MLDLCNRGPRPRAEADSPVFVRPKSGPFPVNGCLSPIPSTAVRLGLLLGRGQRGRRHPLPTQIGVELLQGLFDSRERLLPHGRVAQGTVDVNQEELLAGAGEQISDQRHGQFAAADDGREREVDVRLLRSFRPCPDRLIASPVKSMRSK